MKIRPLLVLRRRLKEFDQEDHVRKYGLDFVERLEAAGFVVEPHYLKDLGAEERIWYGLDGYDDNVQLNAVRGADVFVCYKGL